MKVNELRDMQYFGVSMLLFNIFEINMAVHDKSTPLYHIENIL